MLAAIGAAFHAYNSLKFIEGGCIALCVGLPLFAVMMTWRWGPRLGLQPIQAKHTMKMSELIARKRHAEAFLERSALLMVPQPLASAPTSTQRSLHCRNRRFMPHVIRRRLLAA
jgi:K+ transporter